MQLSDLLVALSGNKNLYITLMDDNDKALITFNAEGYESVEGDLGSRTVKRIKVTSPSTMSISLEDATNGNNSDPDPDPSNP